MLMVIIFDHLKSDTLYILLQNININCFKNEIDAACLNI